MGKSKASRRLLVLSLSLQIATLPPVTVYGLGDVIGMGGAAAAEASAAGNIVGVGANGAAATQYEGIAKSGCTGFTSWGCWAIPMIGLSLAMALKQGKAAGASYNAAGDLRGYDANYNPQQDQTNPYGSNGFDPNGPTIGSGAATGGGRAGTGNTGGISGSPLQGSGGAGGGPAAAAGVIKDIQGRLAGAGATLSPDGKTLTTKDGRKFDMEKGMGGTEQDLVAMGLTSAEASAAMAASSKIAKQIADQAQAQMKAALAGRDPASMGAAAGGGGGGRETAGFDPYAALRAANQRNRAKPKLSGLTKKLGDDTIGVSGDDIFEMITRRYKARDEANEFLKNP